jgi:hypothetical protein
MLGAEQAGQGAGYGGVFQDFMQIGRFGQKIVTGVAVGGDQVGESVIGVLVVRGGQICRLCDQVAVDDKILHGPVAE